MLNAHIAVVHAAAITDQDICEIYVQFSFLKAPQDTPE
jgi:hypothetical protein